MDIIIKSFNRAFYLDRCIYSIYKNISGTFTIKVLDDGTPEKYLLKIQEKYPDITIYKSENYSNKVKAVENNIKDGTEINGFSIPTKLWYNTVKNSSPYFLITEDDVWFTDKTNVDELLNDMNKYNIELLKLGWLGNINIDSNVKNSPLNSIITSQTPKIFTAPKVIMKPFFFNKYKFFSILYKLKLVDNYTISKYWVLNSILMGMYKKEYWLKIWENMDNKVNEIQQILNASLYYRKNRNNKNFICRLNKEIMQTTFSSSATNSYHKYKDIDIDINQLNYILNEKWLNNELDITENYPKDFSENYITQILDRENNPKVKTSEWKRWVKKFKDQYRQLGCKID